MAMSQVQTLLISLLTALCASLAAILVVSVVSPAYSMQAHAASPQALNKPVMIIRFNKRNVFYDRPLYNIVRKAMKAKSDVVFNVVSYVPASPNPALYQRFMNQASTHMRELGNSLAKMGVERNRVRMFTEAHNGLQYDEIHIYVY